MNDLYLAIRYYKMYHFAEDTNGLECNDSVKLINKKGNHDLRKLTIFQIIYNFQLVNNEYFLALTFAILDG